MVFQGRNVSIQLTQVCRPHADMRVSLLQNPGAGALGEDDPVLWLPDDGRLRRPHLSCHHRRDRFFHDFGECQVQAAFLWGSYLTCFPALSPTKQKQDLAIFPGTGTYLNT